MPKGCPTPAPATARRWARIVLRWAAVSETRTTRVLYKRMRPRVSAQSRSGAKASSTVELAWSRHRGKLVRHDLPAARRRSLLGCS